MIKILAHRQNNCNPNDNIPYDGIEVDVWATAQGLQLGHDVDKLVGYLRFVLPAFTEKTIAINAKSNGLAELLFDITNHNLRYFIFDASVPESLKMLSKGLTVFTRQSEYEWEPSFYEEADGVWMDQMKDDWVTQEAILEHICEDKEVCVVSPDLHGRPYKAFWKRLRESNHLDFYLCTKYPEHAKIFFNE